MTRGRIRIVELAGTARRLYREIAAASVGGLVLLAQEAHACPVCFSETEEGVLETYYLTAAFMTALPLIIVGSVGFWVYRRQRAAMRTLETS